VRRRRYVPAVRRGLGSPQVRPRIVSCCRAHVRIRTTKAGSRKSEGVPGCGVVCTVHAGTRQKQSWFPRESRRKNARLPERRNDGNVGAGARPRADGEKTPDSARDLASTPRARRRETPSAPGSRKARVARRSLERSRGNRAMRRVPVSIVERAEVGRTHLWFVRVAGVARHLRPPSRSSNEASLAATTCRHPSGDGGTFGRASARMLRRSVANGCEEFRSAD
jgi:hypothetical protein